MTEQEKDERTEIKPIRYCVNTLMLVSVSYITLLQIVYILDKLTYSNIL